MDDWIVAQGCPSFHIRFDKGGTNWLVMTIPCPLKHERLAVEKLISELNQFRLGEVSGAANATKEQDHE